MIEKILVVVPSIVPTVGIPNAIVTITIPTSNQVIDTINEMNLHLLQTMNNAYITHIGDDLTTDLSNKDSLNITLGQRGRYFKERTTISTTTMVIPTSIAKKKK